MYLLSLTLLGILSGIIFNSYDDSGDIIWKKHIEYQVESIILKKSTLCVSDIRGTVYGIDPCNGCVKWRVPTQLVLSKDWRYNLAPVVEDNTVYYGGYNGSLYMIEVRTGEVIRKYSTQATRSITNTIYYNDKIVYGTNYGIICYNVSTNDVDWQKRVDLCDGQELTIYKNTLIAYSVDKEDLSVYICAFDLSDGKLMFKIKTKNSFIVPVISPVIWRNMLYIVERPLGGKLNIKCANIYAYDPNNDTKRMLRISKLYYLRFRPIIVNGILISAKKDGMIAFDINSETLKWELNDILINCQIINLNDIIIVGCESGRLLFINGNNGKVLQKNHIEYAIRCIYQCDNYLYIGTRYGYIYKMRI